MYNPLRTVDDVMWHVWMSSIHEYQGRVHLKEAVELIILHR